MNPEAQLRIAAFDRAKELGGDLQEILERAEQIYQFLNKP